jgi:hypothetical protein
MRHVIRSAAILAALIASILLPGTVYAVTGVFGGVCSAGGNTSSSAVCQDQGNTTNPLVGANGVLITVANIIALVAGIVAVIVIIIAGFQYITSAAIRQRYRVPRPR